MDKKSYEKSKNVEKKLKAFTDFCRKQGMKITPQRIAIYRELVSSQEHPSATMIYRNIRDYFPNISLGTVNSTLLTFAEKGITHVIESSGEPKRFDPNLKKHHHFKCTRCGKIVDFEDESYDKLGVPRAIKKKYVVRGIMVNLEGLCDACRRK